MYTYPVAPAKVNTDGTVNVHALMKSPNAIAKRLRTLADYKFFSDYLLTGRYTAQGGAILYETGEEIFPIDSPEAIAPGAEFPLTQMTIGDLSTAKTSKWGQDHLVTDEAISRMNISPVDRALTKLVNGMVKHVDSLAVSVALSKLTMTHAASGSWRSGTDRAAAVENIILTVLAAESKMTDSTWGYSPDTIVLNGLGYAQVMATFTAAGLLPREGANPVLSGSWPNLFGFTWVTNPNWTLTDPVMVDRAQFGGMADENIQSPGYSSSNGIGVEVKVMRNDENDRYRLRARRVTVPVVLDGSATLKITGTGVGV